MIIGDKYYIDDIETGLYEVSKEEYYRHQEFIKSWQERFMSLLKETNEKPIGRVIITGTGGEFNSNDNYKEIFCHPENYNYKTFNTIWED